MIRFLQLVALPLGIVLLPALIVHADPAPQAPGLLTALIGVVLDLISGVLFFAALVWGTLLLYGMLFLQLDPNPARRNRAKNQFKWALGGFLLWTVLRATLFDGGVFAQIFSAVLDQVTGATR